MLETVRSRLAARVPGLRSVEGAASLMALADQNALPHQTPAAHVIWTGLTGGQASAAAGAYVQAVDETLAVVLTIRTNDATGRRALEEEAALRPQIVEALAGWAPGGEVGVFRLLRAGLVRMMQGTLVYQFDFAISDQLRITP